MRNFSNYGNFWAFLKALGVPPGAGALLWTEYFRGGATAGARKRGKVHGKLSLDNSWIFLAYLNIVCK